ncbi:MAG: LpxD N-terminal domain-containing protein [bacterium]|nr:LpxD N-terminal domain-containing protein [bacterium]
MKLTELAQLLQGSVAGDDVEIYCVCGIDEQHPHAITFAENSQSAAQAEDQGFKALVIPAKVKTNLPHITVANPRLAYAQLLQLFHPPLQYQSGIHTSAIIAPSAAVAPSAYVGPYAIINERAEIGENAVIEAHALVGTGCRIGSDTRLLAHASLGDGSSVGTQCLIGPHTRITAGSIIGDDVEIGARCILEECQIDQGCRIDNMVLVRSGAHLGPGTILVSHTTVQEGAQTGMFCVLAAEASAMPQTKVGNYATVGGRVVISADIPDGQTTWSGNPPLPHREDMRRLAQRNAVPKVVKALQKQLKRQ